MPCLEKLSAAIFRGRRGRQGGSAQYDRNANSRSGIFQVQPQEAKRGPSGSAAVYDTFQPRRRKMDIPASNRRSKSKERDCRGSGGLLLANAFLLLSFWLFGKLATLRFGYILRDVSI
ncbi:hypothetical protein HOY82DRAFT_603785 [Tuber indicum]|nr:hypothetical protein HOY82DRAFT_603785 [Tuber indicum]